jgi:hypothetical protein
VSDNILVALPEQVSLELLDEGPSIAEEVLQPRGPVLDVALEVITGTSTFISLVVGLTQIGSLLRKLISWRRSSPSGDQTIDIRLRDGFTLSLDPGSDEVAIAEAATLILQHLSKAAPTDAGDRRSGTKPTGRHRPR